MTFLKGRTALVTGGGSGIGAVIAQALAAEGCRLILVGRRADPLDQVRSTIGSQARTATCHVSNPSGVAELADELADEDVSILINNAGVAGPVARLIDTEPHEWDDVFAANARGTYLMCRAFLPKMMARKTGDIINLASVSGKRPLPRRTPYCASKMAVLGLTSTLAFEVGDFGINVNSLSPGPVEGERMDRNFRLDAERMGTSQDAARASFVNRAALGRLLTEKEVAQAVVAMLRMPGMTGADIDLSAGMVA